MKVLWGQLGLAFTAAPTTRWTPNNTNISLSPFFFSSNVLKPPQQFASEASGRPSPRSRAKQQQQQQSQAHGGIGAARRQENLRWAAELSFQEGSGPGLASRHWQEQVGTLQRQLDFSTSMCQTLLQDQQVGKAVGPHFSHLTPIRRLISNV